MKNIRREQNAIPKIWCFWKYEFLQCEAVIKFRPPKMFFFENCNFLGFGRTNRWKPHFPFVDFDKIWHAYSLVCPLTTVKISRSCVNWKKHFLWMKVVNWNYSIADYQLTVHKIFFDRGIKSLYEGLQKILFVFHKYMSKCVLWNWYELWHYSDNIPSKKKFRKFSQLNFDVF